MKTKFLTGLIAATAALAGMLAEAAPASAFTWNSNWTQPRIYSKSETGFDETPFQKFVRAERMAIANSGQFLLNPNRLKLRVFVVDIGAKNIDHLRSVPEPSVTVGLIGLAMAGLTGLRQRQKETNS